MLEEKLLEARGALAQSRSNNEKLTITIQQTLIRSRRCVTKWRS